MNISYTPGFSDLFHGRPPRDPVIKEIHDDLNDGFLYFCPGCGDYHFLNKRSFSLYGTTEYPTISPNVTVLGLKKRDGTIRNFCRHMIRNGKIRYYDDSEHDLRGQVVDMLPVEQGG